MFAKSFFMKKYHLKFRIPTALGFNFKCCNLTSQIEGQFKSSISPRGFYLAWLDQVGLKINVLVDAPNLKN